MVNCLFYNIFFDGVNDTGKKLFNGVNDSGKKFVLPINFTAVTCILTVASVNAVASVPTVAGFPAGAGVSAVDGVINTGQIFLPVSLTPVKNDPAVQTSCWCQRHRVKFFPVFTPAKNVKT
jgi:hypothetical protein